MERKDIIRIGLTVLATIVVGVSMSYIGSRNTPATGPYVPQEFSDARVAAISAADDLTARINASLDRLVDVRSYENIQDTETALALVEAELETKTAREEAALAFAGTLEDMAGYVTMIRPEEAAELAAGTLEQGTELVQRLINYNLSLNSLFIALQVRLTGEDDEGTIQGSIDALNDDARALNAANESFNELWDEFDTALGR